jgi:hypothetical protein
MMRNDKSFREPLIQLLKGGNAHLNFTAAIKALPSNVRGKTPDGAEHSPWQLLEHMRIAQWDILEFTRNPDHVSPPFPEGYWPKSPAPPSEKDWEKSVESFGADLKAIIQIVENESTDLFAKIPHGEGQTILREVLLVADHNTYHLGQFVLLRRLLGAWK